MANNGKLYLIICMLYTKYSNRSLYYMREDFRNINAKKKSGYYFPELQKLLDR